MTKIPLPPPPTAATTATTATTTTNTGEQEDNMNTTKQDDWIKRVELQRSVACIEHEVKLLSEKCSFLTHNTAHQELPVLQRQELHISGLLGNGSFSEVHEVWKIQPSPVCDPIREEARNFLETTALDDNRVGRYAIKHLRRDLALEERNFHRAAADLVMEALFLANLKHPNIIKIQAWSGGASSFYEGCYDSFFLIVDRLDETLSERVLQWRETRKRQNEQYPPRLKGYTQQIDCAYQLANALDYLHSKRIVFRDLKPENVGFKGNQVLLFDFGLCRELPEPQSVDQTTFKMSGVGTRRYMAPEIFYRAEYNEKVDVYSWSLLFYTMISTRKPFETYDSDMHASMVCKKGVRPYLYPGLPSEIKYLLQQGWSQKHTKRPSMAQISQRLLGMLQGTNNKTQSKGQLDIMESSLNVLDTFSNVICDSAKIASKASSLMRLVEYQMVVPVPTLGRSRSIDHPELHHLRSAFL